MFTGGMIGILTHGRVSSTCGNAGELFAPQKGPSKTREGLGSSDTRMAQFGRDGTLMTNSFETIPTRGN